jgi:hypothetical protein
VSRLLWLVLHLVCLSKCGRFHEPEPKQSEKLRIKIHGSNIYYAYIQGEHKRTLHFQNDAENKFGALWTSHIHQSIEKLSKFRTHLTETRYVLRESHGRCREIIQRAPNFVQSVPSDGWKCTLSVRISCTRRKWILGWVVTCETVREMHVAQLLQTLSSLTVVG